MSSQLTNSQVLLNALISQAQKDNSKYPNDSEFFEYFATSQLLKEYDLNDEEIESGLCDSVLDGGCDGIYLFADDNLIDSSPDTFADFKKGVTLDLVILQVKTSPSFGEDSIMKWKVTCENLLDASKNSDFYRDRYSERVRKAFDLFKNVHINLITKNPKINFNFFYATKGTEVHPNVKSQASELETVIKKLYPNPSTLVKIDFIGAQELYDIIQKIPNNDFILKLAENPISIADEKVYLVLVKLSDYFKFIVNEKNELIKHIFEANVRDYQGKITVNQDIQNTLENPSDEDFWWLNNGVTVIASNAHQETGRQMSISDPEIVNGLQTSTEVYRYFSQYPDKLNTDTRSLLLRIIVTKSEESRDKIIFATNNQTTIQKSSLRATDNIHRHIEMYFKTKDLFYDRRKNYYKNIGNKASQIISVSFLSQCLIAVLLQSPNDSRARPSTLLTSDERYEKLYNPDQNLDVFYNSAKIGRQIEIVIKRDLALELSKISDIKFYVLFSIFAKLVKKIDITVKDIVSIDISTVNDDFIIQTANDVLKIYEQLGGNDKVAKGPELIKELKDKLKSDFVS
jgi:hypothetical protein